MRALAAIWLLLLALLAVQHAEARTIVWPDPAPKAHLYQRWVNESRVPTPAGVLRVYAGVERCGEPAPLGCAWGPGGWVAIAAPRRDVFLHELGHIFDFQHLRDSQRHWFKRELRFPAGAEWRLRGVPDWRSPAEMFADAYEECALNPIWHLRSITPFGTSERLYYRRQITRLCRAIKRVGRGI